MKSAQTLRAIPLFAKATPATLRRLCAETTVDEFGPGELIARQGDLPMHIQAVVKGRVGLIGRASDGGETVIQVCDSGAVLWVSSVVLNQPRIAWARTVARSTIANIPANDFREAFRNDPAVARATAYMFAAQIRAYASDIKELKLKTAAQRLATYLCGLSAQSSGPVSVNIPIERRLLAGLLGTTPESLSRAFAGLRPQGVSGRGKRIDIADVGKLRGYGLEDGPI